MNYNGEKFLDVLYKDLYRSDEVLHTKEKSDTKEESIKRYLERLEKVHNKADTESKKSLIKKLYFDRYVIKREELPIYLDSHEKDVIIDAQKETLSAWIDYLTDENAKYPMWAKYWVFQQILKIGARDEMTEKYAKRDKKTVSPFIKVHPAAVAKCIENVTKLLGNEPLTTQEIRKLVSNISLEKMYIEYQNKYKKMYKSTEGIWVKYNQGNMEDAKRLSSSLVEYDTGWCTESEATAKDQIGEGDFYVFYTKDENEEYKVPRIAIRLYDHTDIAEIRGIEEHQNLEKELIPTLESKLNEMTFLSKKTVEKNMKIVDGLKELVLIKNKTVNNVPLIPREVFYLYTRKYGFGYVQDPLVDKVRKKRNIVEDYKVLINENFRVRERFIKKNLKEIFRKNNEELRVFFGDEKFLIYFLNSDKNPLKRNKQIMLKLIKIHGSALQCAHEELKDDKEIVLAAINQDAKSAIYASDAKRRDREIIFAMLRKQPELLSLIFDDFEGENSDYIIDNLSDIEENKSTRIYVSTEISLEALNNASQEQLKDKKFITMALQYTKEALKYASPELQDDEEIVLFAIGCNGLALEYASERLRNKKSVVKAAVTKYGLALQYASPELQDDEEIVSLAIRYNGMVLQYASERLRDNDSIVSIAVEKSGEALQYASYRLRNTKEIVLIAVRTSGKALQYSEEFKNDRSIVLEAMNYNNMSYDDLPDSFKEDTDIILEMIQSKKINIESLPENLKNNRAFMLNLIRLFGKYMKYASEELKEDKDFVLEAIKIDSYSMKFVSEKLKKDKDFIWKAVQIDPYIFVFADQTLKEDREYVLKLVKSNPKVFEYAKEYHNDREFILEVLKSSREILKYLSKNIVKEIDLPIKKK